MKELFKIANAIDNAIACENVVQFTSALQKRQIILANMHSEAKKKPIPSNIINRLIIENKRWLSFCQKYRDEIKQDIIDLKNIKNTSSNIAKTYGKSIGTGRCISDKG